MEISVKNIFSRGFCVLLRKTSPNSKLKGSFRLSESRGNYCEMRNDKTGKQKAFCITIITWRYKANFP